MASVSLSTYHVLTTQCRTHVKHNFNIPHSISVYKQKSYDKQKLTLITCNVSFGHLIITILNCPVSMISETVIEHN